MSKACFVLTNGFEEAEALCPVDMLQRGGVSVDIYCLAGSKATGRSNVTITDLHPIEALNLEDYDMLVLPGGPQWKAVEADERTWKIVDEAFQKDMYVSAICAMPAVLGRKGYLKGKNYTCFASMNDDFGGNFLRQYVVKDGKLTTACSAAASIDFGLSLVATLEGEEARKKVEDAIYYDFKNA